MRTASEVIHTAMMDTSGSCPPWPVRDARRWPITRPSSTQLEREIRITRYVLGRAASRRAVSASELECGNHTDLLEDVKKVKLIPVLDRIRGPRSARYRWNASRSGSLSLLPPPGGTIVRAAVGLIHLVTSARLRLPTSMFWPEEDRGQRDLPSYPRYPSLLTAGLKLQSTSIG